MPGGQSDTSSKARSAAALRANLARRKAQARERQASIAAGEHDICAEHRPAPELATADQAAGTLSPQKAPRRAG